MTTEDRIRHWLFQDALPVWGDRGVDRKNGGFVEYFALDGSDGGADYKRTRVTCRQIYVFSHAALMGWEDGEALARHGIEHLTGKAWMDDAGCFARRTTREGEILDPTPDLYDLAFALFALGWAYRATGDADLVRWAHRSLDAIERHLRHPVEGYWHDAGKQGWRQQNPHMHLLEAALSVYEATRDERFADLAREVAGLFTRRFFDLGTGTLAEFFTDEWQRAPAPDGRLIEPGHQLEWAWILTNHDRLLGGDTAAQTRALIDFAERHGVDPQTGRTFNAVRDDGAPIDLGSRSWPNTERMKAAVALWDRDGTDPRPVIDASANWLFSKYFDPAPRGMWIDAFDTDGQAVVDKIPTSTLYHVVLAFAEALRVLPDAGKTMA